ncbi:DNA-directed RNA polymerase subunit B [Candidatus Marsarchaeota archaeon]|nr:DNA-directed RNA polymerase subunit B [Candidatus Marsarchaeota archaeon]MCL5092154.1 DNA-directed RNA polymerase subunit B [Candidatus Marsarchaeota archaeon]
MATNDKCHVYLDGRAIGAVKDGNAFAEEIRANRRQGIISNEVNVAYFKKLNEVHINADKGRVRKPYILMENGKSKFTPELREKLKTREIDFNYLVRRGIIEYLDAEEEENVEVAIDEAHINKSTTHMEVDPAIMFGLTVNSSVYPEFNNAGRHPVAWNFMKQSQGLYSTNFNDRYDARSYILFYPQLPLIDSITYRTLGLERHPQGQNMVVALSTYYGYNMKDAVVFNKAAVDRGLGRSAFFRSYADEEMRYPGGQQDHFTLPPPTAEGYRGEHVYSRLGEDGIIEPEMDVKEGDALVGKISPPRFLEEQTSFGIGEEKVRDNSVELRSGEQGTVDRVMLSETIGATRIAKVRIRSIKIPEIGDKFASRQSQKGVISMIVNQEDMPYTKDGIVPDMLLNPIGLPNRMTYGHMLEMLGAKAGSLKGKKFDGTPFSNNGAALVDEFGSILKEYGFDEFGDEEFYDGRTGRKFKGKIFTGVVYYQRLWHMVSLKLQVRSRGPVQILTRQPTEGKPRKGGLKFGEMEREALIGYGASLLLKERMLDQSDKASVWICRDCGDIGYYDYIKNVAVCPLCGGSSLEEVEISYAFKLLIDELKSMHILPRVRMKSD